MPQQPYHAAIDSLPQRAHPSFDEMPTYTRTSVVMDGCILVWTWLHAGFHWPEGKAPDQHPFDQTIYVLSGHLDMTLDGKETYNLAPGDVLYIPADLSHRADLPDDEGVFLLEVFAPVREDYRYTAAHQPGATDEA